MEVRKVSGLLPLYCAAVIFKPHIFVFPNSVYSQAPRTGRRRPEMDLLGILSCSAMVWLILALLCTKIENPDCLTELRCDNITVYFLFHRNFCNHRQCGWTAIPAALCLSVPDFWNTCCFVCLLRDGQLSSILSSSLLRLPACDIATICADPSLLAFTVFFLCFQSLLQFISTLGSEVNFRRPHLSPFALYWVLGWREQSCTWWTKWQVWFSWICQCSWQSSRVHRQVEGSRARGKNVPVCGRVGGVWRRAGGYSSKNLPAPLIHAAETRSRIKDLKSAGGKKTEWRGVGVKESQRQWKWNSNFQSASRVCDLAAASGSPAVLCRRSEAAKQVAGLICFEMISNFSPLLTASR